MIGTTVSHYEILEKLGEGGMGVVYKAHDTKLDRDVALKFLPERVADSEQDRARFMHEAKAASALNHPNICTIHGIEEHEGQMFLVMEFVDGQTLTEKKLTISFKQAIDIGIQLAEGLAAAHEKGIVHRDIKPDNIMIRKDGIAQIMDFGLAKLRGVSRLTKEGSTVGTAGYMSPEQVQGQDVDHRSDIFSFGVVMYELFSGQMPFRGVHETALLYEIVNVDPAPMASVKPALDPELDGLILECLEKDATERYQSAREIAKDLRKIKRDTRRQSVSRISVANRSRIVSQRVTFPLPTSAVPSRVWIVTTVILGVALAALAVYHVFGNKAIPELTQLSFQSPPGQILSSNRGGHIGISPDGKTVAFVAVDSSNKTNLWIRPLDSPAPIMLQGTEGAYYPFWSFDSKMIAYFADGKLKKIDAQGGPSFSICDVQAGRGGSWNAEGIIIFAPNSSGPLHQVSAAGGTSKQLTILDSAESETNHRWPFFLPDGEHFFYTVQTNKANLEEDADHIRVGSLNDDRRPIVIRASSNAVYNDGWVLFYKQNSLLAQRFSPGDLAVEGEPIPLYENLLYSRDFSKGAFTLSGNNRLVFLKSSASDEEMMVYATRGSVPQRLKSKVAYIAGSFSNDGRYIALDVLESGGSNTDLWIHDLERNNETRLTFDKASELVPQWTPDGAKIYFSSNRSGHYNVYEKNSSGVGDDQLVYESKLESFVTDVSSDGSRLLLSINTQGPKKWDLAMYDLVQKSYTPLLTSEFSEWLGSFSPDGKWYAYQSNETGKYEIYVRPTDGSPSKWQISTGGGRSPVWLRNGKEILYDVNDQAIISMSVTASAAQISVGKSKTVLNLEAGFQTNVIGISRDGEKILVKRTLNRHSLTSASIIFNWQNLVQNK